MAITRLADIIEPEVFSAYVTQRTMELSELITAGVAVNSPEFDALASGPHRYAHMPYFEDLTGDDENMLDEGEVTPGKITTEQDIARKIARVKAYGSNGLAAYLSGADPLAAIGNLFAAYWVRRYQEILMNVLDGAFAAASMSGKVLDISGEVGDLALINASTTLDALQLMGDAKGSLTAIAFHSIVETYLAKNDLIEYVKESEAAPRVPYFLGKRVIIDDSMGYESVTKVAEAYLFGAGAVALGNGSHTSIQESEVVRLGTSYSGEDLLVNRRLLILHPRGVAWQEPTLTTPFPSNADLATGTNWLRVYEEKAIRIVKFIFKIA